MVASEDGTALGLDSFTSDEECTSCHERHWEEVDGSMHAISHTDSLYRSMAEPGGAEAGEEVYAYCSGCHAPQGVVTGLIPTTPESELVSFEVVVHNVGAGHSLPTSLTELREMWVDLKVMTEGGEVLFRSGRLEPNGDIPEGTMRFGTLAADAQGNITYKPWEITQFLSQRLFPQKDPNVTGLTSHSRRGFPASFGLRPDYSTALHLQRQWRC